MEWLLTVALWVGGSVVGIFLLVLAIKLFAQPDESGSGGGGGGMFGGLNEAFNPAQHNADLELERMKRTPIEAPVPGDRSWESDAMRINYSLDGTPETIVLRSSSRASVPGEGAVTATAEVAPPETVAPEEAPDPAESDAP